VNKPVILILTAILVAVGCTQRTKTESYRAASQSTEAELRADLTLGKQKAESQDSNVDGDAAVASQPIILNEKITRQKSNFAAAAPATLVAIHQMPESVDRENYLHFEENGIQSVSDQPVSTFSIDVDTAAYSNIRRMLMQEGRLPPHDAVKIEEMVNYFSYSYPEPASVEQPFSVSTEIAPAPWQKGKHLMQIGLKGYTPEYEVRPSANLVFLVDVSGSMQDHNKLALVKRSLNLLLSELREDDRIALVVYAGAAGVVLDSTSARNKRQIKSAIRNLTAGGSTNGGAGIRLAYDIASENFIENGINRVIIASDGDMNVGTVSLEALKNLIEQKRELGVSLTTLGYGSGNYNYALMEQLADVGNGNAAYIDSIREAQKVLVNEMQSTLFTIAKDVKIQVEFNPSVVSAYRLLGYENRLLAEEDFRNDKVDAGEIGAGHTVTALYEVTLVGSEAALLPQRRYAQNKVKQSRVADVDNPQDEIAYVSLRYKRPDQDKGIEIGEAVKVGEIVPTMHRASKNLRFAAAVAGFGQLLRGGRFTGDWDLTQIISLARGARGEDRYGYRSEFVSMAKLAKSYLPQQG